MISLQRIPTVEEALLFTNEIDVPALLSTIENELEQDFMEAELRWVRSGEVGVEFISNDLLDEMQEEHIGRYEYEHRWEW